jgi:hypothetical protein
VHRFLSAGEWFGGEGNEKKKWGKLCKMKFKKFRSLQHPKKGSDFCQAGKTNLMSN